jgi:hypothetical protein
MGKIWGEALKNICSPPPRASKVANISQFHKGMGKKIWGVWCKGVQCSVMGELKQIKISSLKYFDHCIFASGMKRSFVKP